MEIELKFPIENPEKAINKLNALSKKEVEERQKDTYFIPNHRNFVKQNPVSEWLRLRETKGKTTLNYKNWHNKNGKTAVSCDEFETEISDTNNLKRILKNLDFNELITVDKLRKVWKYKDTIIAVDEVADLGFFIEIEASKEFENTEKTKEHLYQILKELNIETGQQDFKGYPHLLLKKKNLI